MSMSTGASVNVLNADGAESVEAASMTSGLRIAKPPSRGRVIAFLLARSSRRTAEATARQLPYLTMKVPREETCKDAKVAGSTLSSLGKKECRTG